MIIMTYRRLSDSNPLRTSQAIHIGKESGSTYERYTSISPEIGLGIRLVPPQRTPHSTYSIDHTPGMIYPREVLYSPSAAVAASSISP